MATITKRDLVISLSNETGLTQREVFSVIQGLIDSVTASLAKNDEVVLRNFGTFLVKETKAKIGRNPNQPEKDVKIPPRTIVKFKPGKEMEEKVRLLEEQEAARRQASARRDSVSRIGGVPGTESSAMPGIRSDGSRVSGGESVSRTSMRNPATDES